MNLKDGHEIIGTIKDLIYNDDIIKIIFSLQKEILIPKDKIQYEVLSELIGEHVGIIHIDNKYKIRKIRRDEK